MVGSYGSILRHYSRSLHYGKYVTLHTFPGNIGTMGRPFLCNLIDLVEEYNPHLLHPFNGILHHFVHIDELVTLLLLEYFAGFLHRNLFPFFLFGEYVAEHIGEV